MDAVTASLARSNVVAPIDVFKEMGLLNPKDLENWRMGRVPYLERVIRCNLAVASRILRILRKHADHSKLRPSMTVYCRWGKGAKTRLQFSKTNAKALEDAYSTHFIFDRPKKKEGEPAEPSTEKLPPTHASRSSASPIADSATITDPDDDWF